MSFFEAVDSDGRSAMPGSVASLSGTGDRYPCENLMPELRWWCQQ